MKEIKNYTEEVHERCEEERLSEDYFRDYNGAKDKFHFVGDILKLISEDNGSFTVKSFYVEKRHDGFYKIYDTDIRISYKNTNLFMKDGNNTRGYTVKEDGSLLFVREGDNQDAIKFAEDLIVKKRKSHLEDLAIFSKEAEIVDLNKVFGSRKWT